MDDERSNHSATKVVCSFCRLGERTDAGEHEGSDDHEDGLDKVGPDDGRESPGHREEAGDAQQDQDGHVDRVLALDLKLRTLPYRRAMVPYFCPNLISAS